MHDQAVLAAIESALSATPDNQALRLHLATLLVENNRGAEALEHCVRVLNADPASVEAMNIAARAAEQTGDAARAESYRRLTRALAGNEPPASPQPAQAVPSSDNVVRLSVVRGGADALAEVERSNVTLADVAGMEEVKRRLNLAFLAPMRNPEVRKMYGKSLRGGLLLYGPPGCGKTFIARAVAGELGAQFMAVGLSDVLDMWLGQSEKNLHELFETARRNAPCVLFFDELDALGRKRSLMRHSAEHNVVNQLLAELDSVGADNEGVFVLAATNHPWDVDSAMRRPGRLDRMILVLPPDKPAREAILRSNLDRKPVGNVDYAFLVAKTEDFSGADLVHLCDSAAELAMESSLLTGKPRPIDMNDFREALKELRPSTRPWFETAKNYAQFANDGGVFDDLLTYLRKKRIL